MGLYTYISQKYKAGKYSTKAENRAPSRTESTGLHCSTTFRGVGEGETARQVENVLGRLRMNREELFWIDQI